MKRLLMLSLAMAMLFLAACGGNPAAAEEPAQAGPVEHSFDLSEGEERHVEGQAFSENVTISGDNAVITFENCEFPADVVLTSEVGTRVVLLDCTVAGSCVLDNGVKEATLEAPSLPKFMTNGPVDVACKECYGAVFALGDFEITYNGEKYTIADSELYYDGSDPDADFVAYEGQEANIFYVGQWWENGEHVLFLECEYDPNL